LVALANFMRLSLQKAAHAVVAWSRVQEIRVRSGRDDKLNAALQSGIKIGAGIVARNEVHHSLQYPSSLALSVVRK
jgi:hypothetical protein